MIKNYALDVDIKYQDIFANMFFTSGDVGNTITFTLYDHGTLLSLSGLAAKVYFLLPNGVAVENTCAVGSSTIVCTLGTAELADEGIVRGQLKVTETTHVISTNSFYFEVRKNLHIDEIVSTTSYGNTPTILTGVLPPTSTPLKVGNLFINTSAGKVYCSTGTSSSADWKILN